MIIQAETEIQGLLRKVSLLESDLEAAEDRAESNGLLQKTAEASCEELERENKTLKKTIEDLESKYLFCQG